MGENKLVLPAPLPAHITMNAAYLERHKQTRQFRLYSVVCDYFAVDPRHMSLTKGEVVSGFSQEGEWVCGFKER